MKKLSTTLVLVLSFILTYGQMQPTNYVGKREINSRLTNKHLTTTQPASKGNSRWLNYAEAVAGVMGLTPELSANFLFPDTTVLVNYGDDGYSGPWIHAIADVVDVSSFYWNDAINANNELLLNRNSTFTLDSIAMYCFYNRELGSTVVDTLEVNIMVNNIDSIGVYYFAGATASNFGTDTVRFAGIDYNMNTNSMAFSGKYIIKIPLTVETLNDTTEEGINKIQFKTPAGLPTIDFRFFTVSYNFIPGYTWVQNVDTLSKLNSMRFISYKEVDGSFMVSYIPKEYNCSYIVTPDVRYESDTANSWNKNYIPSFAFSSATYSYEHHLAEYLVTGVTDFGHVSINDLEKNSINLSVYPNPTTSNITVDLNSNESSIISLYNLVGQNVKQVNSNDNSVVLNVSDLSAGTYLLKVTQGNKTRTGKVVIK